MKPFSSVYIADGVAPGENVDIVEDIYVPALKNSNLHKRLTFSFSSQGLVELAIGLEKFIENEGEMHLIIGSPISYPEEKAIKNAEKQLSKGEEYKKLCMIRLENLFRSINEDADLVDSDLPLRIDLLTQLISLDRLKIKFAFKKNTLVDPDDKSIQHSKIAIFYGLNDEKIVWGGSANFSRNALIDSAEEISVFKSWDAQSGFEKHGNRMINSFDKFWSNQIDDWHTCKVPSKFYHEWKENHKKTFGKIRKSNDKYIKQSNLKKEQSIEPRDHQTQVIEDWEKNGLRGIVEHATGSGKTITGILAIKKFFLENQRGIATLIVPNNLLQDQWIEELEKFLPNSELIPIGGNKNSKWKKFLHIWSQNSEENSHKIFVCVLASARSDEFINKIHTGSHNMILVDEAHRIGANDSSKILKLDFGPRMAVSATIERQNDENGNKRIHDFFGETLSPIYGLKDAIKDGWLVSYKYFLKHVYMTAFEEEAWVEASKKIARLIAVHKEKYGNKRYSNTIKKALIFRSKIVKKAENKINSAIKILKENYSEDDNQRWLVYCEDTDQLDYLYDELTKADIFSMKYHSQLDQSNKDACLKKFRESGGIILSIKCLDEGVDIPAAEHALIIASTQNRREFIQRRGRVLRKDKDNPSKIAKIYDLVTIPQNRNDLPISLKTLLKTELERAKIFSDNSVNVTETQKIKDIEIDYSLNQDIEQIEEFEDDFINFQG